MTGTDHKSSKVWVRVMCCSDTCGSLKLKYTLIGKKPPVSNVWKHLYPICQ